MASVNLKVSQAGNMLCLMLPKDAASMLGVEKGDVVTLTKDTEGHLSLAHHNEEFERQMAVARDVMVEWRDALRELAKK